MNINTLDEKFLETGKSTEEINDFKRDFQPKEIKRSSGLKKTFLIVAIISILCLTTVVSAATPYGKIFFGNLGGLGLHIADEQGLVDKNLGEVTCNGITMRLIGAITGNHKIILSVKFFGLENKNYSCIIDEQNDLKLFNSTGIQLFAHNGYEVLYMNTNKDKDGNYIENYEIDGSIEKNEKMKLHVSKIGRISGDWILEFDLTYNKSYEYNINKQFVVNEGIIYIDKVIIDCFSTSIEIRSDKSDIGEYHLMFSSDKEYNVSSIYTGTVVEGKHPIKSSIDGVTDAYKIIMRPVQPNSTLTLQYRKFGDQSMKYKTLTFKLNENDIVK